MRPLGQLESWCLAPGCCLLISNHSQIPAQPLLAAHRPSQARPLLSLRASFHLLLPFTRFPHSLLSNFSVLLSFLFLSPPIYQISPVVSNLILNLAFVIFKTSSFFPVQQISPCRSFLFLTSPLPPIYRIRILLYFPLVVTSHLSSII